METGFVGVILGSITVVALLYWGINKSSAVGQIGQGAVTSFGTVARTFQGR